MDDTNSLIEQRKAKLKALESRGIFPFKNKFTPTETWQQARDHYVEGREVGKSMFIDVRDQSGRIQCYAQKNVLGEEPYLIFTHLDLGDFVGVKGTLFTTKTGEISIKLAGFTILAKALRPLPGKWHGLEDTEIRYRQRYLDLTGLGLPVIWLCRKDELEKTHFDTRQYNFIVWESEKLPELSRALQNRIEATIGRGPIAAEDLGI